MAATPKATPPPRKLSAAILRAYASNLQGKGMLDPLRSHLSPRTHQMMLTLPLPTEWIDSSVVYEIYEAVGKVYGKAAVRLLAYEAMRDALSPVLKPMVDVTLAIHGSTPNALFSNFDRIATTFLRDISFFFVPTGERSGRIEIRYETPAKPMAFAAWEGVFSLLAELTGVQAHVSDCEMLEGLTFGRMTVTW